MPPRRADERHTFDYLLLTGGLTDDEQPRRLGSAALNVATPGLEQRAAEAGSGLSHFLLISAAVYQQRMTTRTRHLAAARLAFD